MSNVKSINYCIIIVLVRSFHNALPTAASLHLVSSADCFISFFLYSPIPRLYVIHTARLDYQCLDCRCWPLYLFRSCRHRYRCKYSSGVESALSTRLRIICRRYIYSANPFIHFASINAVLITTVKRTINPIPICSSCVSGYTCMLLMLAVFGKITFS